VTIVDVLCDGSDAFRLGTSTNDASDPVFGRELHDARENMLHLMLLILMLRVGPSHNKSGFYIR